MGCGCGAKRGDRTVTTRVVRPPTNSLGMFDLVSMPRCNTPYHGAFRSATIYVVGFQTDQERLFVRGDVAHAVEYAKQNKLSISHLPARQFCHDAMVEFFGA